MRKLLAFAVCAVVTAAAAWVLISKFPGDDAARGDEPTGTPSKRFNLGSHFNQDGHKVQMKAGEFHQALIRIYDLPGVRQPEFVDADRSTLSDQATVIGIVVDGLPYALARDAMLEPAKHIVNLMMGEHPLSVTYCDLADCVRVLHREKGDEPIDLRVGGLDEDYQMVLLFEGERYGQTSQDLPLTDYPFEVLKFGDWKKRYPQSKVYPR